MSRKSRKHQDPADGRQREITKANRCEVIASEDSSQHDEPAPCHAGQLRLVVEKIEMRHTAVCDQCREIGEIAGIGQQRQVRFVEAEEMDECQQYRTAQPYAPTVPLLDRAHCWIRSRHRSYPGPSPFRPGTSCKRLQGIRYRHESREYGPRIPAILDDENCFITDAVSALATF